MQPHIATISVGGQRFGASVLISYDGIEYVGRLWFAEEDWEDAGIPDRGVLSGRSREEVVAQARRQVRLSSSPATSRSRRMSSCS